MGIICKEAYIMRELTQKEKNEIREQSKLIKHYRTGILLARMKIKMIKDKPQIEKWTKCVAEPIEF